MRSFRILDVITSPEDLKVLSDDELIILAKEIREEIVATTSLTGGHVASSLGAVEIILAAHSLLHTPKDHLVFDVGHQAYAHKLLTGRLNEFKTLRTYGGISGFPKPSESPYDVHPSGHASDSLSIAAGLAKAKKLNDSDEKIVAVIGDASLSGGMAFEALNYIGQEQLPLVIILNDNEMSISHNVGALMKHLGNIRANQNYRTTRDAVQERLESGGAVGNALVNFGRSMKESMKQFFLPHSMIFEQLGIVCTMPINGNNLREMKEMLATVLDMDGPVLIHAVTKKGAGYEPAENDPVRFHGTGPFDMATGNAVKKESAAPTYTSVFGKELCRIAEEDKRIIAITAAMRDGTGLKEFSERFPDQFVDVGIAEEHALGMAAGLAIAGLKPVVALYSTFLQRAFDQVIIDAALPDLDIVFAIDRAGLVGEDGPTHHGQFDLAYLREIPSMRIMAPSNEAELVGALHTALALSGPVALRYPRGEGTGAPIPSDPELWEVGKARIAFEGGSNDEEARGKQREGEGPDVAILAFGCRVAPSAEAARLLAAEGIRARVYDMRWVKPIDEEAIREAATARLIVTVENGVIAGGAGSAVLEAMARLRLQTPVVVLGIPDTFVAQGKTGLLLRDLKIDGPGIAETIKEQFDK